ncbi:diguanylate cyclase domain-containing protein [Shewanella sp. 10N.286.48.A6]|uniref:diguanylate cyclase domain-containing protein n=1 Tax=Shewanella sp. 10N.286.48.A6 TaxID=1880833 RepID=UPI000C84505D|nr:transporter substrate-binding domain-containing protein [Shewanella sp. 10N.286.48.A6]PMH97184.1 deoxyguanosine kinase [Shewanella sp. 10N.286.48.A6]
MKFTQFIFVIIVSLVLTTATWANTSSDEILVSSLPKTISISMSEDAYPYQFVDQNGNPSGLMVDLWHEWSVKSGIKVIFKPMPWKESLSAVEEGKVDAHIGMVVNAKRKTKFAYANQITTLNNYVYLHNDIATKKSITDLKPFKIGVIEGTSHLDDLLAIEPSLTFKTFKTKRELVDAVIDGELYAFAAIQGYYQGIPVNFDLANKYQTSARISVNTVNLAPAVAKRHSHWVAEINQGFAQISAKVVDDIEKRWFGLRRESGGLMIAMQVEIEPFVDINPEGQPHGLFVDIWQLWSEKTGISINFIPSDMNGSINFVKKGLADVHIGYPESDSINTGLHRANHLYTVKSRFFSYQKELTNISQVDGKRIGIFATSPYIVELRTLLPNAQLRYYDSMAQMVKASQDGDIVGFVASSATTSHYLLNNKKWADFNQLTSTEFSTQIYNLTNVENTELAERITNGFKLISLHELNKIERKWLVNNDDRTFISRDKQIFLSHNEQKYLDSLGALKLGYLDDWAPMEYQNEQGEFSGVNSDVTDIISNQLGIDIIPVAYQDWDSLNNDIKSGTIHMVASMAKSKLQQPTLEFTDGYWPSPWAIATSLTEQPLFNLSQYTSKRIAVIKGYSINNQLRQQFPGLKIMPVADVKSGLKAVSTGQADLFIEQVVTLAYALNEGGFPDLKIALVADLAEQKSHIGVYSELKKLIPLINRALETIDETKQQQMYQQWVAIDLSSEADKYQHWFKMLLIGLVIVSAITLLVIWGNRRLKAEVELRKQAQLESKFAAEHDPVTHLPNRCLLDDRLACAVTAHLREQHKFAILFIDIDKFKAVNDTYGHHVGDQALVAIAISLKKAVRKSDTVSRFGGDEFVILLNNIDNAESAIKVAETITANLTEPLRIDGISLTLTASIGMAIYPDDGDNAIALLKCADKNMYRNKKSANNLGYQ